MIFMDVKKLFVIMVGLFESINNYHSSMSSILGYPILLDLPTNYCMFLWKTSLIQFTFDSIVKKYYFFITYIF